MHHRLQAFIRYRDIVWYRTLAGLKSEARQQFLGYIWLLLEPCITTAIVYVVYVFIFQTRGADQVVMLLVGTIVWQWFESSVMQGMGGIKAKLHIMIHFKLPKYIFPLVGILTNTWKFLCVFLVLLTFCAACGFPPNWHFLWLPLVLAAQLVLIIGLALPLAIAVTYFSDLTTVVSSIFRLLMFISGVFFTVTTVPPAARRYFYLNPMAGLIESYRYVIMWHQGPNLAALAYALCWGLSFGTLGLVWCSYIDGKILKRVNG
ncbi:MAG TPA: ABC transporter permease [Opitutales bacterium]|nr:ABC transporter permease [Opitutales bacterium]